METFCLVLTGRLVDGHALDTVEPGLAQAFSLSVAEFRERVWRRAPLIIRQGLTADYAAAQTDQLRAHGVDAAHWLDSAPLIWLRRDGRTCGPLPQAALATLAQTGDTWCIDGTDSWRPLDDDAYTVPPPIPAEHSPTSPPPLPRAALAAPVARSGRRVFLWSALVITLLLTVALLFHSRAAPVPSTAASVRYVPRPLQPLAAELSDAPARCARADTAPTSSEDAYLLTGGQRHLTGRTQRNGATYVAEAMTYGKDCSRARYQLYLFHDGQFVGPALAASDTGTRVASFALIDPQTLRYKLPAARSKGASCRGATESDSASGSSRLVHDVGGWRVHRDAC